MKRVDRSEGMKILDKLFRLPDGGFADEDSAHVARLFRRLLQYTFLWLVVEMLVVLPLFVVRQMEIGALTLAGLVMIGVAGWLLRSGQLRAGAGVYLGSCWAGIVICSLLSGGIRSPHMAQLVVFPLMTGLLLGRRLSLVSVGASGLLAAVFGAMELSGHPAPSYFPMPVMTCLAVYGLAFTVVALAVQHTEVYSRQEALRLNEQRLRLALHGANAAVFDWDLESGQCLFSKRFFRMLGYERDEATEAMQPANEGALREELGVWKRAVEEGAAGQERYECEVELRPAGNGTVWMRVGASVTRRDGGGKPLRIVGTLWDVTVVKLAQQEMGRARDLAQDAMRTKASFLANMSHEIRTPLSAVVGLSELLKEQKLDREAAELVELIHSSASGLIEVVNDILELSRIEAGRLPLHPVATRLKECCRETLSLLEHMAGKKNLGLRLECVELPAGMVKVDPNRLRQVLLNLLGNAIKFTEKGEIRLRVEWEGKAGMAKFSVIDTGIGIAEEYHGSLFAPFTQVDTSASRAHGGAGLGLSICRKVVEEQGGRIGVKSRVGEGSTFWFTLPVEVVGEPEGGEVQGVRGPAAGCGHLKVLVVEDNGLNRLVATRLLSRLGVEADTAEDGEAAVRAAGEKAYDLILMDVQMPGVNGLDATRAIRRGGRGNPLIVALTAHVLRDDREECLAAGMDDFLSKPVVSGALKQVLERAGGRREGVVARAQGA